MSVAIESNIPLAKEKEPSAGLGLVLEQVIPLLPGVVLEIVMAGLWKISAKICRECRMVCLGFDYSNY